MNRPTTSLRQSRMGRAGMIAFVAASLSIAAPVGPTTGALAQSAAPTATHTSSSSADLPRLYTGQQYVEDVTKVSKLNVADKHAVFQFVLDSLPDKVRVYPTEHYYYFYFYDRGVKYAGNIRLDTEDRDKGFLYFSYFKDDNEWQTDEVTHKARWGAKDGIIVEKLAPFSYRITSAGKSVIFELNNLTGVAPPAKALRPQDHYFGPVFDDSGVRFFLIFDRKRKTFRYILDETIPVADELVPLRLSTRLVIGRRTGVVFYDDRLTKRKILVGVFRPNVMVNNYLDGPFDQLPDDYFKGDELRRAILEIEPDLKGRLDRVGKLRGRDLRYEIAPYIFYMRISDFRPMAKCLARRHGAAVYRCLPRG